jgi:hypothetical protein
MLVVEIVLAWLAASVVVYAAARLAMAANARR